MTNQKEFDERRDQDWAKCIEGLEDANPTILEETRKAFNVGWRMGAIAAAEDIKTFVQEKHANVNQD